MTTPDDALEAHLRRLAAEHDSPPDLVTTAARAAWEVRDLDAELVALVADSWTDAPALTTRSAVGDVRMLAFAVDGSTVEVDVAGDADARTVRVRGLVPDGVQGLAVVTPAGPVPTDLLAGQFDAPDVPRGPVRLELVLRDGRRVLTPWFSA